MRGYLYILAVSAACCLAACSTTKSIPHGDYLYQGASVSVQSDDLSKQARKVLAEELGSILRPQPNRRFLGMPIRLWIYHFWGTPGKEKGLGNWIQREAGEPPVLMSDVHPAYQMELLLNRMENRGYFRRTLLADSTVSGKKIKLHYTAFPGKSYLIDTVFYPADTGILDKAIRDVSEKSFLIRGHAFDLDVIKAERERINARLKEQGFYYFSPDDILILVDSTNQPFTVSLRVMVKPGVSPLAQQCFTIDRIYVYPRHTLMDDSMHTQHAEAYNDLLIVDPEKTFRPSLFQRTLVFRHGDLYNRTNHNRALNKLIDLGVFKYVENRFRKSGDSTLDAYYYLTPYKKKSFRIELSGRNTSTNFTGAEASIAWQNRNTFRGAEQLRINAYAGTDFQISGINKDNDQYRYGAEITLSVPKFITPFPVVTPSAFVPRTRMNVGYDRLHRVGSYVLNSFRASFGYQWKESIQKAHTFTLTSVTYVQPSNVSEAYMAQIDDDPSLANAIRRQFILGPTYDYVFTNTTERALKHTIYFNANLDLSGNILGLVSGADYREGSKEIFNAAYAQYVKGEADIRYYNDLGRGSSFAWRVFAGFGLPYGNSRAMPYVKQYFAGGTVGLRGFRARSLGPGTFRTLNVGAESVIAADQTADIKLETSFEYRPHISGILNGAIFIDAGNIWLLRPDFFRPGASLSSDFLGELAVDFGLGLRFDFSFFVLRTDLAIPLRKPWHPEGDRWVIDEIAFGVRDWRRENLVFNLAIGYPF